MEDHQQEIADRLLNCGEPLMSPDDLVALVEGALDLRTQGVDRMVQRIIERAASDDGSGRSRDNDKGIPFRVARGRCGLELIPAGKAVPAKSLPPSGVFTDRSGQLAALVVEGGCCLAVLVGTRASSFGIIQRMGPWVLDRSNASTAAWRKANRFDANLKATRLPSKAIDSVGGNAPLAALALYLHKYFMAPKGAQAWHADRGWVAAGVKHAREGLILDIVRRQWPELVIRPNARAREVPELGGLELDIWIPEWRLGIEHQGEQHSLPVEHWGGKAAFQALQERDRRKQDLCSRHGITLVEFQYHEALDAPAVIARIERARQASS